MTVRIGYLLPTRERIMAGQPETGALLALAERAERLGLDSVWVGDSLLARPRHEPLALLAAVAGRVPRLQLGTAVLLPGLRNPVLLAHQVATIDRISEGRLILGIGIARDVPNIRAEFKAAGVPFEKRVGRVLEGLELCRALWTGNPTSWSGRWEVDAGSVLGPTPHRPGGPPVWLAGALPATLERVGKLFDGWIPNASDAPLWRTQWREIQAIATAAGRDPRTLDGSIYLTASVDADEHRARQRLHAYLQQYYGLPGAQVAARQACYAGPESGFDAWLKGYADAGATHLVVRCVGDHERHMEIVAGIRSRLAG